MSPRGARVRFTLLPARADGRKQGIDDFFAAGGTADELLGLATDDPAFPDAADGQPDREFGYRTTPEGLFRAVEYRGEVRLIRLTNFPAWINAEVIVTDGAEERRELEVEATVAEKPVAATVDAEEFAPMGWVVPRLGPMAILAAGTDTKDHARAAIQAVSGQIPTVRAYTPMGWVRVGGVDEARVAKCPDGYRVYRTRLGYGLWHVLLLAQRDGFLPVLTDEALWRHLRGDRFTTPLVRKWAPWLSRVMTERGIIGPLTRFGCEAGLVLVDDDTLDELVGDGLRTNQLHIGGRGAGIVGRNGTPEPGEVKTLEKYLPAHGPLLGKQAEQSLDPLLLVAATVGPEVHSPR